MQSLTDPPSAARATSATQRFAPQHRISPKLAVAGAASGAAHWAVLVLSLGCLAMPVAVAIQDGPSAARALLFIRPGHYRPGRCLRR
ncbi:MAG TPA: hypothetical protein VGO16_19245 [Pseudonocardiaceae bacterium]|nr:hypothetical protein [Pseudonocardiaceae bacterium]